MPTVSKPYTYVSGATISPTQVNANEDALYNAINGNLDEDNLSGSTQIPNSMLETIEPSIVDAHSDDEAEFLTATSPGDTGTTSLPDKLSDELERLRYRFLANNHLISAVFTDSAGVQQSIGWIESAPVGPQLFVNNGFEVKTSAVAGDAPDGWTLEGTPTSFVITAPGLAIPAAGLNKKALRTTYRTTANEGLKQVLKGLKASTKYIVGATYARVSGSPSVKITTTGALASGDYQNLNVAASTVGTAVAHFQSVFQTTTAGGDVTVKFINGNAAADVIDYYQVWAYELKDSTNLGYAHIPMQTATDVTASTFPSTWSGGGSWRTDTLTSLSLTQYVPATGYRFIYDVTVPYAAEDAADSREGCRVYGAILLTIDAGATNVVSGPVCKQIRNETAGADTAIADTFNLQYIVENPTPGSSYAFAFRLGVYDDSDYEQVSVPPSLGGQQMEARATLRVERL